jgi:hypothetical protein
MKIGLNSDFTDYYDRYFDQGPDCELIWHRLSGENPDRIEQFTLLQAMGFEIPMSGVVRDIYQSYQETLNENPNSTPEDRQKLLQSEFIVYPDLRGRSGTMKKMALEEAHQQHPDCLAAYPILTRPNQKTSVSQRLFLIGDEQLCIETRSDHPWCSTAGNSTSELVRISNPLNLRHIQTPLLAIDCMRRSSRGVYAISLDLAPRLQGTPIEKALPGEEIAQIIRERLEQLNAP